MKQPGDRILMKFSPAISTRALSGDNAWLEGIAHIVRDGVLPAVVLILLTLTVNLMIEPVQVMFGTGGLLVYILFVLAVGVFALDRSIQPNTNEPARVWYGAIAGLLMWFVVASVLRIGNISLASDTALILIIMASLVMMTVWKQILTVGLKFFAMAFLANWVAHFLLAYQSEMAGHFHLFDSTYRGSGFLALAGVIVSFLWILKADTHVYRMWAAVTAWISVLVALMVFMGMPV